MLACVTCAVLCCCGVCAAENVLAAWVFFLVLTWVHVWANIRALRCLVLSSLNQPRLRLLLQHYIDQVRVCVSRVLEGQRQSLAPPRLAKLKCMHFLLVLG